MLACDHPSGLQFALAVPLAVACAPSDKFDKQQAAPTVSGDLLKKGQAMIV